MLDEQSFKKIYYTCNVKPLIKEVYHKVNRLVKLFEANILATTEDDINEYEINRLKTVGNPNYNNLNMFSTEETKNEIKCEIELAKKPKLLSDGRTLKFDIYKVFDENKPLKTTNEKKEIIGYVTYRKDIKKDNSTNIIDVSVFRTSEKFKKEEDGVSVIDEMEKILIQQLKLDKNISSIIWTCVDEGNGPNTLKNAYLKRFKKYDPIVESWYNSVLNKDIATFIINRITFLECNSI